MLNIAVCIKVVPDPEAPASTFKIAADNRHVLPAPGVPPVLNPYDENALEAALKIKDGQATRITAISAGKTVPRAVIKKALAVGADDLVLIEDEALADADGFFTALVLTAAVRKLGGFDLIFTGRMASDTNAGQVGLGVAQMLGMAAVCVARKVAVTEKTVSIERVLADGYESVGAPLPCLVTVSHESGELRMASVKSLMEAQKQPVTLWGLADLSGITPFSRQALFRLYVPEREIKYEEVPGDTPEAAGANLAVKLREVGLI
jgi:electron transfer flavoprotein beta subunit